MTEGPDPESLDQMAMAELEGITRAIAERVERLAGAHGRAEARAIASEVSELRLDAWVEGQMSIVRFIGRELLRRGLGEVWAEIHQAWYEAEGHTWTPGEEVRGLHESPWPLVPNPDMCRRIARTLGVDPEVLLREAGHRPDETGKHRPSNSGPAA